MDGPARSPFLGARALLVFSDLSGGDEPEHGILKQVFGLTQAEDRLARHLARGLSLDQAAAASGIARDTARNQLRSIFAKAETRRQSELIALLGRL